ncbi:MAG: DUF4330 domain-containing protein [Synechococcaceae cyanobacterium SM2_3_60]|nr:DUF4330 domain-containing protein [Synechococcaceae cyanobacterium SM2_3_60]
MIDGQGRLFGKVNVIDLGALVVTLLAIAIVFFFPTRSGGSLAQIGLGNTQQTVEIEMIARGVSTRSLDIFALGAQADVNVRNVPSGQVEVIGIEDVTKATPVVYPDGRLEMVPEELYRADVVVTLAATAQVASDGIILGNTKVKVGVGIEIETNDYLLRGTVMAVRAGSE